MEKDSKVFLQFCSVAIWTLNIYINKKVEWDLKLTLIPQFEIFLYQMDSGVLETLLTFQNLHI